MGAKRPLRLVNIQMATGKPQNNSVDISQNISIHCFIMEKVLNAADVNINYIRMRREIIDDYWLYI